MGHGLPGDEGQVMGGGVVPVAGQAVGGEKHRVRAAKLPGAVGHHPAELLRRAADMLGNGHRRVVAALQHEPVEHLFQGEGFPQAQVDAGAGHAEGVAPTGDGVGQAPPFEGQQRGHDLGGGGHG